MPSGAYGRGGTHEHDQKPDSLIQLFDESELVSVRDIDLLLGEKHTFAIGMLSNQNPDGTVSENQDGYYQVPPQPRRGVHPTHGDRRRQPPGLPGDVDHHQLGPHWTALPLRNARKQKVSGNQRRKARC